MNNEPNDPNHYKSGSIDIDLEAFSRGLYALIIKHPDSRCLSLGMLPAQPMQLLQEELKKRIPDHFYDDTQPVGHRHREDGAERRREIIRKLTSRILKLATTNGACQV